MKCGSITRMVISVVAALTVVGLTATPAIAIDASSAQDSASPQRTIEQVKQESTSFKAGLVNGKDDQLTINAGTADNAIYNDLDARIINGTTVDVTFQWQPEPASGLEFRDLYGRLLLALTFGQSANSQPRLGVATDGADVDQHSVGTGAGLPQFSYSNTAPKQVYEIALHADFATHTVRCTVTADDVVIAQTSANTRATSLARWYAVGYNGIASQQTISDLHITQTGSVSDMSLAGKRIYAFGDSIIDGFLYRDAGFVTFTARREGMTINDYARNGATVEPSDLNQSKNTGGQISKQVDEVPQDAPAPDVIVFNGGTNDTPLSDDAPLDTAAYAKYFEDTLATFHKHWPDTPIVYVSAAKMSHISWAGQQKLHDIATRLCKQWGVYIADVFSDATLDTRDVNQRMAYTFESLGPTGLPGTPETTSNSNQSATSGMHPNFDAIEKFYVPVLDKALHAIIHETSADKSAGTARANLASLTNDVADLSANDFEDKSWPEFTSARSKAIADLQTESSAQQLKSDLSSLHGAVRKLIQKATVPMYMVTNPYTGRQLFSTSLEERRSLIASGWIGNERPIFMVSDAAAPYATALYRLYNPFTGEHILAQEEEALNLARSGWAYDSGIDGKLGSPYCYMPQNGTVPVYRLYDAASSSAGKHRYTTSRSEADTLVQYGWTLEDMQLFAGTL